MYLKHTLGPFTTCKRDSIPQPNFLTIKDFLDSISPKLNRSKLDLLNKPFSCLEIKAIIKAMPSNKPPGPDRLSAEYCCLLSTLLNPYMEKMYNTAATSSYFPL